MSISDPVEQLTAPVRPVEPHRSESATLPTRKIALGEELPIFCEKCGYALHGLPQTVCAHCTIRQFHCPECGHHQPINTLRPAAQKLIGRIRAFFLALSVFIKLNFFGWILFGWLVMGYEQSYQYRYETVYTPAPAAVPGVPGRPARPVRTIQNARFEPRGLRSDDVFGFSVLGLLFGMVGRMFLLRWRHGYWVGLILASLVLLAIAGGALWAQTSRDNDSILPTPFTIEFLSLLSLIGVCITLGASIVWGIWVAVASVFLPKRTRPALLDFQRSLSNPPAAALARD
jgi:hypothetical protein